ncbi:copper-binding protein [Halomonas binhaiensis]|uniref:Copper-binding protein n=2 Tax=Halomonas binhaiensis TaxID=2562282 RepID=A0A5C1NNT9_9GAMM|nr:copper-binding protein [Halomonas binhaiensis]
MLSTTVFATGVFAIGVFAAEVLAAGSHEGGHDAVKTGAVNSADIDRTIRVEAGDIWFDTKELQVSPGETIRFEVINTGQLEHEFVIGDAEAQQAHREMMQQMSGSHDAHGGHDMAEGEHGGSMQAVTVAPGETKELVWTAPQDVAQLEYACNIPGHYEVGMTGTIDLGA